MSDDQTNTPDERPTIDPDAPDAPVTIALTRGTNLGRYVILKPLSEGSVGAVYTAYDSSLERKVAIKVLRTDTGDNALSAHQNRLLREAKAMAKLTSPNVNVVHDVGIFQGRIFVAMEYVAGGDLRQWLSSQKRSWREIVSVFHQAGQGLQAAHRAGLVHRDVKPDNILIGEDGRVRVSDFGLAISNATQADRAEQPSPADDTDRPSAHLLAGTPAYMSPEQHRLEPANPLSDQFSFAAALYEALYEQPPFAGETLAELRENVLAGKLNPPPAQSAVPTWLQATLARALQSDPAARFDSLDSLLKKLQRRPKKLGWAIAVVALIAVVAGICGAWEAGRSKMLSRCRGAAEQLADIWHADRRAELETALAVDGDPQSAFRGQRTVDLLDRYGQEWTELWTEACEATHIRQERSPEMLDKQMGCLQQRKREYRSLIQVLGKADDQVRKDAVESVLSLSPVSQCGDLNRLMQAVPPPEPAIAARVAALRDELADITALRKTGKYKEGLQPAESLLQRIEKLGYPPLTAEGLLELGRLSHKSGKFKESLVPLNRAIATATACRHDHIGLAAQIEKLYVVIEKISDREQGLRLAQQARSWVDRLDLQLSELHAELLSHLGTLHRNNDACDKAIPLFEKAIEIHRTALGNEAYPVAADIYHVAVCLVESGRYDEAAKQYREAYRLTVKNLGPLYPNALHMKNGLAIVEYKRGNSAESIKLHQEVLDGMEQSLGPDHPDLANPLNGMGNVLEQQGKLTESLATHQRVKQILETSYGATHPRVAIPLINGADVKRRLNQHQSSLDDMIQAHRILSGALPDGHIFFSYVLSGRGLSHLGLGNPEAARSDLEAAWNLAGDKQGHDLLRSEIAFGLARAMWQQGQRDTAGEKALTALALMRDNSERAEQDLADLERWMKERNITPPKKADSLSSESSQTGKQ